MVFVSALWKQGKDWFGVDISQETLSCTNLGQWRSGYKVNLERALRVGDALGGHFVAGHVDTIIYRKKTTISGDCTQIAFCLPENISRFVAAKGSVALNGVSLTVNLVENDRFCVNIIPYTKKHTNLLALPAARAVNLEVDLIARYLARLQ